VQALNWDDFASAKVLLQRQLMLRPDDRNARYQLARVLYETGQTDDAVLIMRQLAYSSAGALADSESNGESGQESVADAADSATPNEAGTVSKFSRGDLRAAHWLLANRYLQVPRDQWSEQEKAELHPLLQWLYSRSPRDLLVTRLYSEELLRGERLEEALPLLLQLAPLSPSDSFRAAVVASVTGSKERATALANQALELLSLESDAERETAEWLLANAECQLFLGNHGEGLKLLAKAVTVTDDEALRDQMRQMAGQTLITWSQQIDDSPNKTIDDQLQVLRNLQQALNIAPNNPLVLGYLSQYLLTTYAEDEERVVALRESLISGTSPGISHFLRGTLAHLKGNAAEAKTHLELSAKHLPTNRSILNNLAFVMAGQGDEHLTKALDIIEGVIVAEPNPNPNYFDTRGGILLKLGRYQEAIADLEYGLQIPGRKREAQLDLAECYERLGNAELAETLRQAANNG